MKSETSHPLPLGAATCGAGGVKKLNIAQQIFLVRITFASSAVSFADRIMQPLARVLVYNLIRISTNQWKEEESTRAV
jgi:hypothetical protein